MLKHARESGFQVPEHLGTDFNSVIGKIPSLNSLKVLSNEWMSDTAPFQLSTEDMLVLGQCHNVLVKIVSPARPQTLLLYQYESMKNGRWKIFGSVPLIRRLLAVAFICLVAIIGLATSPLVKIDGQDMSLFDYNGLKLVLNAGFLLAAAGLGASFSALFRAREYVTNYTYNPTYEASYWIEFAMGLIAGLILSELVRFDVSGAEGYSMVLSSKVTISLLGGFGGLFVYRVLNRLVYVLEGIIRQETGDKLDAELRTMEANTMKQITKERSNLAKEITKIQSEIVYKDMTSGELNKRLENLVDNVVENNYKPVREIPIENDPFFDQRNIYGKYKFG
ncbi:MAG: hypothetical protein HC803_05340 [Saprospiraceae bacterium]|nr:hypothetical protein [Saprospiraceae bacterium]